MEMLEVRLCNQIAPFILVSRLRTGQLPQFLADDLPCRMTRGAPGSLKTFPSNPRSVARSEWLYWRRSHGGRHLVTTGRGSSSPRCSPKGWSLRATT
ncbi:MAG: hypothetical protein QOK09_443 [Mycobacterium sp.]|nr:hypothetical protein [Mycobacterium sp.]